MMDAGCRSIVRHQEVPAAIQLCGNDVIRLNLALHVLGSWLHAIDLDTIFPPMTRLYTDNSIEA
jgi:hypothetical protein